MTKRSILRLARRFCTRLNADQRGLALIEFALTMPFIITIGGYGIELTNLAITNMRVSQIALNLADHASRVGLTSNLTTTQLRETDINDVLYGAQVDGAAIALTTNGRITISSLENVQQSYDSAPVQRIHWQRCLGRKSGAGYDSTYGATTTTAGSNATAAQAGTAMAAGMGATGSKVSAPTNGGVMFVEINYDYQPLFGSLFVPSRTIGYAASFIVRDRRDFSMIYNPSPTATRNTCALYTSTVTK